LLSFGLSGCAGGGTFQQAEAAARRGDYETAIELFSQLAETSQDPSVFGNRANCYSYLGNLDAALADYQKAIELVEARAPQGDDPLLPSLYYNRGNAYDRAHQYSLAVADYERTIEARSDYPDVKNNLAWILATCPDEATRNPQRSVELIEEVLSQESDNPGVLDTAAACYAATGDFARAISLQEQAIRLSSDSGAKENFQSRLKLYRNKQPYVAPQDDP
jgi:tetratricopeptide (TPR) repeat protein